jgi:hypothetical protein
MLLKNISRFNEREALSLKIRSIGLRQLHINTTITIPDIIHRPVAYLKHDILETGFCLRLQVVPTQLGQIDRASPCCLR